MGERFGSVLIFIIIVFAIIVAIGQVNLRMKYNEAKLHRQLQYERFLAGEDYRAVFADHRAPGTSRKGGKR